MSTRKVACPGCLASLNIAQVLPANLRCPRCQTRFRAAADGSVMLNAAEPASGLGRIGLLALIAGGFMLFMALGAGLLAYCLFAPGVKSDADDDAPTTVTPVRPVPLEPVAFVKKAPQKNQQGFGTVHEGKPTAEAPAGVAKKICSDEMLLPANHKEIDEAIAKGVAFLKARLDDKGHFRGGGNGDRLGGAALIGLTLLSCGVGPDDPQVNAIAARVRGQEGGYLNQTYDLACCIWFLDKLGNNTDADLIRKLGLRLIAGQNAIGGWGYECHVLTQQQEEQLLNLLEQQYYQPPGPTVGAPQQRPKAAAAQRGQDGPASLPVLQFKPGQKLPGYGQGDNSVTQFAVLALWAAQKYGVPAQRSLAMAEAHFRQNQGSDGSWGYSKPNNWRDSMTCAGLIALAAGKGVQYDESGKNKSPDGELGKDAQIQRALTFVGQRLKVLGLPLSQDRRNKLIAEKQRLSAELRDAGAGEVSAIENRLQDIEALLHPRVVGRGRNQLIQADAHGDLYFMWSVERVGVLFDLNTIGGQDWHAWGAEILLHFQKADGSWVDIHGDAVDTCFALLFLKRVNVAHDLTRVLQGLGGVRDPGAKPGNSLAVTADATAATKVNPTLQPGAAKVRAGYAMPVNNQPNGRARRRRRRATSP
jgi:hypothetical protein